MEAVMASDQQQGQLSWGDALFLYLEREGTPLNIASVSVFDGEIPLEACARFIESKLPLVPRYYHRVVAPPFNTGLPSWEYDSNFDMRNHVREVVLKRGTDAEFKAVAAKLFGKLMDRQHPLWDFTLVRGLKGNRTGVIARVHHCLADGVAGVGLMNVIFDQSPDAPSLPKRKVRFRAPRRRQDPITSLADGLLGSYSNFVERTLTAQTDFLSIVQKLLAGNEDREGGELERYFPELLAPSERLHFNVTCQGPQKYVWAEMPLEEIKKIREQCGATINDVVLAVVTATIRRYAELHDERVKGRMLRMMVPVNLRNGHGGLGNRISLLPLSVPLDVRKPRRLISAVHRRMEFLKRAPVAEFFSLAGNLIGATATALQAIAGPIAGTLPLTVFNLVCTNVPGPQVPLYLLGRKMLHWYPYVPVGGEMAVNCAILTYNGTAYFGVTGDSQAAPDLGQVEKLLRLSIEEFRKMVSAVGQETSAARRKQKPASVTSMRPKTSARLPVIPAQSKPAVEAEPPPAVRIGGAAAAD
jgi:diacylglycerol O-acyltransferase / wax synthase